MSIWMRTALRLLGELLEYPDKDPGDLAAGIRESLKIMASEQDSAALPRSETSALDEIYAALSAFEADCASASLLDMQQAYTEVFDLKPGCGLFMAWHKYGDSPKQGRALAGLTELYHDYGFIPSGGNLPDYLPLMLEFMLAAPRSARRVLMDGFGAEMLKLGRELCKADNIYACVGACLLRQAEILAAAYGPENISPSAPARIERNTGGRLWTTC